MSVVPPSVPHVIKSKYFSPTGMVNLLSFSYTANTYFPLPIFGANLLRVFHAFTAYRSVSLVSESLSKGVTSFFISVLISLPSMSQIVAYLMWWSVFMILSKSLSNDIQYYDKRVRKSFHIISTQNLLLIRFYQGSIQKYYMVKKKKSCPKTPTTLGRNILSF